MTGALRRLLDALDAVAADHGEVHDTMVREQLFEAVYVHFVRPDLRRGELPTSFGMFSPEGDEAVRAALSTFLTDPDVVAFREASSPRERLDAFQDADGASASGSVYDEYFGYFDGEV